MLAIFISLFNEIDDCFRVVTNAVEEEAMLRREMDEDVAELRQDYELTNEQRMAVYEVELAEWKSYEKARVSKYYSVKESVSTRWIQGICRRSMP